MKKILGVTLILAIILFSMSGCKIFESLTCEHDWCSATCELPQTCSKCGATKGEALGHNFQIISLKEVTCTEDGQKQLKCLSCGLIKTEVTHSNGHQWIQATCTKAKTCSICKITEGEPLGHLGDDVCRRCGEKLLPYHKAGTYFVGTDIAAGEYYIKAQTDYCYMEVASDSSGTFSSIIANSNIQNYGYVTLHNGEYFTLKNGLFIEINLAPIAKMLAGVYPAGMYKIGRDISAGEYYIFTYSTLCYMEVASASTHLLENIVCNETTRTFAYITVRDGEYLTVNKGVFILASNAEVPTAENGILSEGMYKVGRDIAPGQYTVCSDSESKAYIEVAINSRHQLDSIVTVDSFIGERYVTVRDGEYITIKNGFIIFNQNV